MRPPVAVALVALVALAGCTGPLAGDEQPDTVTPVDPPATIAEPPAAASPENTVGYESLTEYQRQAFDAAMADGAQFVPNTTYTDDSEGYYRDRMTPFENNEFVRYDGQYYRIDIEQGRLFATYGVMADRASPGENDTVVALADLPSSVRDEVREAITDGIYTAPYGKWESVPEPLRDTDHVRHENETYRLNYVVGDNWAPVMTVDEAS